MGDLLAFGVPIVRFVCLSDSLCCLALADPEFPFVLVTRTLESVFCILICFHAKLRLYDVVERQVKLGYALYSLADV